MVFLKDVFDALLMGNDVHRKIQKSGTDHIAILTEKFFDERQRIAQQRESAKRPAWSWDDSYAEF